MVPLVKMQARSEAADATPNGQQLQQLTRAPRRFRKPWELAAALAVRGERRRPSVMVFHGVSWCFMVGC